MRTPSSALAALCIAAALLLVSCGAKGDGRARQPASDTAAQFDTTAPAAATALCPAGMLRRDTAWLALTNVKGHLVIHQSCNAAIERLSIYRRGDTCYIGHNYGQEGAEYRVLWAEGLDSLVRLKLASPAGDTFGASWRVLDTARGIAVWSEAAQGADAIDTLVAESRAGGVERVEEKCEGHGQ